MPKKSFVVLSILLRYFVILLINFQGFFDFNDSLFRGFGDTAKNF